MRECEGSTVGIATKRGVGYERWPWRWWKSRTSAMCCLKAGEAGRPLVSFSLKTSGNTVADTRKDVVWPAFWASSNLKWTCRMNHHRIPDWRTHERCLARAEVLQRRGRGAVHFQGGETRATTKPLNDTQGSSTTKRYPGLSFESAGAGKPWWRVFPKGVGRATNYETLTTWYL